MTKDEALRIALEVLADLGMKHYENTGEVLYKNTYTAIKAALEAKDEPVAWQYRDANDDGTWTAWNGCDKRLTESDWRKVRPLYTTPPQRKPLTDEEIDKAWRSVDYTVPWDQHRIDIARAIEAAHGIKGEAK